MKKHSSSKELSKELLDCLAATASLIANKNVPQRQFKAFKGPANNTAILLALSGGGDSTALLLALSKLAPAFGFQPIACHINHGLRAEESDKDAQFCRYICEQLKVECKIIKLSAMDLTKTKQNHVNEDTLRQLRYTFLTKFAHDRKISFLLTAHTLDDQIETVLFRLFRGTALSGLRGIEYCRILDDNLKLLRPLLKLNKAQCQKFLESEGFAFCHDSSNSNEIYSRNYIRHKIVPAIVERFPDLSMHLDSLTEIAQAEDTYMDQIAYQLFEQFQSVAANTWSATAFRQHPLALQRRILAHGLKNRSIEVSFKRIDEIISLAIAELSVAAQPLYLNLNKLWRIKRVADKFLWQKLNESANDKQFEPLSVNIPGINFLPEINSELLVETYQKSSCRISAVKNPLQIGSDGQTIFTDLSRIKPPLVVRQRQAGDRIQPLGMSQLVKLKKYLHTHKNGNHPFYPQVLLADQEEVIWLPGIGMSEKIKVIDAPSHILRWRQGLLDKL